MGGSWSQGRRPVGTRASLLNMNPGEVYWADLAVGRRPIIIVSRGDLNRGNYAVAVLCTTAHFTVRSKLPTLLLSLDHAGTGAEFCESGTQALALP